MPDHRIVFVHSRTVVQSVNNATDPGRDVTDHSCDVTDPSCDATDPGRDATDPGQSYLHNFLMTDVPRQTALNTSLTRFV